MGQPQAVQLDMTKAQPITLDMSKAVPLDNGPEQPTGFIDNLVNTSLGIVKHQAQAWKQGGGAISQDGPTASGTPETFNPFHPIDTAGYLVPQPVKDIAAKVKGGDIGGAWGQALPLAATNIPITPGMTAPAKAGAVGLARAASDIVSPDVTGIFSPRLANAQRVLGRVADSMQDKTAPTRAPLPNLTSKAEYAERVNDLDAKRAAARAAYQPPPSATEFPYQEEIDAGRKAQWKQNNSAGPFGLFKTATNMPNAAPRAQAVAAGIQDAGTETAGAVADQTVGAMDTTPANPTVPKAEVQTRALATKIAPSTNGSFKPTDFQLVGKQAPKRPSLFSDTMDDNILKDEMDSMYGTEQTAREPAINYANTFESKQAQALERKVPTSRYGKAAWSEAIKDNIDANRVEEAKSTLTDKANAGEVLLKPQSPALSSKVMPKAAPSVTDQLNRSLDVTPKLKSKPRPSR